MISCEYKILREKSSDGLIDFLHRQKQEEGWSYWFTINAPFYCNDEWCWALIRYRQPGKERA